MISPSQRPLPDNKKHSQQTNIHAPGGIRTHNLNRRAAVDLRLRPRGHWNRFFWPINSNNTYIFNFCWLNWMNREVVLKISHCCHYSKDKNRQVEIQYCWHCFSRHLSQCCQRHVGFQLNLPLPFDLPSLARRKNISCYLSLERNCKIYSGCHKINVSSFILVLSEFVIRVYFCRLYKHSTTLFTLRGYSLLGLLF